MSKRSAIAVAAVGLVGVLVSAFWWLDFQAVTSNTRAQSQAETIRFGRGNARKSQDGVVLYVVGSGRLARTLSAELARSLEADPALGQVHVLEARPQSVSQPAIVAEVEEVDATWTPVYARGILVVDIAYASDGNLSWRKKTEMRATGGPGLWGHSHLDLSDTTRGITSRPAFAGHLGKQAAIEVSKVLQQPDWVKARAELYGEQPVQ